MKIRVSAGALAYASNFVADKKDRRDFLSGVLIEKTGTGSVIVATNGRAMCVIEDPNAIMHADKILIKISPDLLRAIKTKGASTVEIDPLPDLEASAWVEYDIPPHRTLPYACRTIDAKYPDWRTVMRIECDGIDRQVVIDAKLLQKIATFPASFRAKSITRVSGNSPDIQDFWVMSGCEVSAYIRAMGLKIGDISYTPEWASQPIHQDKD